MGERGEILGFYAIAKLKDGGHAFEFMSRFQVEAIRDASQGWQQAVKYKKESSHPWAVHFPEMGRKTVIRRLAKYLPLSIEFQTAAALDGMAEGGKDQHMDSMDGDFTLVPEDAPIVDQETGEITDKKTEEWQPTAEEKEQIRQRELAEGGK